MSSNHAASAGGRSASELEAGIAAVMNEEDLTVPRADDRGDPVIQILPPLVAGQAEFDEIRGSSATSSPRR